MSVVWPVDIDSAHFVALDLHDPDPADLHSTTAKQGETLCITRTHYEAAIVTIAVLNSIINSHKL